MKNIYYKFIQNVYRYYNEWVKFFRKAVKRAEKNIKGLIKAIFS